MRLPSKSEYLKIIGPRLKTRTNWLSLLITISVSFSLLFNLFLWIPTCVIVDNNFVKLDEEKSNNNFPIDIAGEYYD